MNRYGEKKYRPRYVINTIVTVILLCGLFGILVTYLYKTTEANAYENLHLQTKQIKDDISLQLLSDRENLATMANFAAKLYSDGESYDLMFDSFEPIGLIGNIGILTPGNVFITKVDSIDLDGLISFEEEKQRGEYLSGRVPDLTQENYELIRGAVPIEVNGEVVGILYGVIKLDTIGTRYAKMAEEYDAQLFVYESTSGDLVIDTVHEKLGNISFLKERRYNKDYSYEQMEENPNGFLSFHSAYRDENTYMHYSSIEEVGWSIAMARYDSQVFAEVQELSNVLMVVFGVMFLIIVVYVLVLFQSERGDKEVTNCASEIRKILLETSENQEYIEEALKQVCLFAESRSAVFFNTDGEEYLYYPQKESEVLRSEKDKTYLMKQMFHYVAEEHNRSGAAINVLCIKRNDSLLKTNPDLHEFFKTHSIKEISFSGTVNNANHITILSVINAKRGKAARMLAEKISACFSMALNNKNNLSDTKRTATTDALTGAANRVAYNHDIQLFDEERPLDFSCIYVDANELHNINNKYGHAAGDEMLQFVANTLKDVFFGQKVYRMGGDEFLVFCQNLEQDVVKKGIISVNEQLNPRGYNVAMGLSFRSQNTNTEEMVREAEVRMYENKAHYYQNKEHQNNQQSAEKEYIQSTTGIIEIDTMLSVLKDKYDGIYRVSLDTNKGKGLLTPAYLNYNEEEDLFSDLFSRYVTETINTDYRRSVMSFMNYEALKHQLAEGKTPKITYKKNNKENGILSVYTLRGNETNVYDTLWVFEKE